MIMTDSSKKLFKFIYQNFARQFSDKGKVITTSKTINHFIKFLRTCPNWHGYKVAHFRTNPKCMKNKKFLFA